MIDERRCIVDLLPAVLSQGKSPPRRKNFLGHCGRDGENMTAMGATLHSLWSLAPAAARATWTDMVSRWPLWLLALAIVCIAVAVRAGRAPRHQRWAAIRAQWAYELRDACLVVLWIVLLVFGCELYRSGQNEAWQRLLQNPDFLKNVAERSSRIPIGTSAWDSQTRCVGVPLPAGFSGGSYALPFKPAGPSPPVLYNNGQMKRKGIDYTVSDSTIVVNFKPTSQDSLSVWYTTNDPLAVYLP